VHMQDANGACKKLNCGANTLAEALPACTGDVINTFFAAGVDSANDGCVDPFDKDAKGLCSKLTPYTDATAPKLVTLEHMCVEPATIRLTQQGQATLAKYGVKAGVAIGQCERCGKKDQLPCTGLDFGGCYVNEGFVLDQSRVRPCYTFCEFNNDCFCHECLLRG
jgi:hypothetical protein